MTLQETLYDVCGMHYISTDWCTLEYKGETLSRYEQLDLCFKLVVLCVGFQFWLPLW